MRGAAAPVHSAAGRAAAPHAPAAEAQGVRCTRSRFLAMSRLSLVATPILLVGTTSPGLGQTVPRGSADSAAVRVVVEAAVKALAQDGRIEVVGRAPSPWLIRAADTLSPVWRQALGRLYPLLNGRPITPTDTAWAVLEFGPVVISGDSLRGSFEVGRRWRECGVVMQSSAFDRVVSVRPQGWWMPATTVERVIGDPSPCPKRP
jgi:hypothetical protein